MLLHLPTIEICLFETQLLRTHNNQLIVVGVLTSPKQSLVDFCLRLWGDAIQNDSVDISQFLVVSLPRR